MRVVPLEAEGVLLLEPTVHGDPRGFLVERYRAAAHREAGVRDAFVQDNHSRSSRGVVRGLHFQRPPHAQAKLVSVVRGRIFDVAVDLRVGSPTFGRWAGAVLDDEACRQLYVPEGFAHGFAVLSDVADVLYKISGGYEPEAEGGVRWDDPDLAVPWGIAEPVVSDKDRALPHLAELGPIFAYGGAREGGPGGESA